MNSKAGTAVNGAGTLERQASAGEVVLYADADGTVKLDVRLERENLWLTQRQMAELFATERSVITKHLNNIFGSGELERETNVQKVHTATSDRPVAMYGLDAIISVGYRVNSKRGTQFRIWATKVLREHLTKGYTANERRLSELNQTIRLISEVVDRRDLSGDEAKALLAVVGEYSFALDLLDDYDRRAVSPVPPGEKVTRYLTHEEVLRTVDRLRERFGGGHLFGVAIDVGLESSLGAVMQSVGGVDAYPTLEAKAAHLLYFVVKNHPFVDGNKRIGAALFLWFLEINGGLWTKNGDRRFSEVALVATTLLIAESVPQERELIIRVVTHLLSVRPGD